ncbi:glutamate decarboxylase [Rhodotorula toruloides]|uniref:Glutamate decarboxylase n=1 Tax=Rhodotorula toruloides TaxID=5286 RepID=A0A2S9ZZK6_RHOTO|nr:glutamate decarboxylase [Rhodotorula toruloides]
MRIAHRGTFPTYPQSREEEVTRLRPLSLFLLTLFLAAQTRTATRTMSGLHRVPADSRVHDNPTEDHHVSSTIYGSRQAAQGIPRFEMAEDEMDPRLAQRFVKDELLMNGNPAMNLASFVTTFQEAEAEELMKENLSINFIDVEEYPAMGEIESRCVNMIARLFNAPLHDETAEAVGVSTIGSSEAIILAVLAAKRRWKNKRIAEGKSTDKPNIVMSSAVQVCWEKAARYLEVEEKYWYCRPGKYTIDPQEVVDLVDENTVLVVGILGTTYTGQYEDIETLNDLLDKKNKEKGLNCTIHVDAASGGFVVPFVNPSLKWDFRLPLVSSINTSGHKYGLVYAGVGWAFWRSKEYLPEEILFTVNYLGSPQVSFTLNFSKSAIQVVGQYYQLLRLGKAGYRAIMQNLVQIADHLSDAVANMEDGKLFEIISEGHGQSLPLVAFKLKEEKPYDEFAIASHMRQRGWIIPAYTLAPHTEKIKVLRVVVREDLSRSRCDTLIRDLKATIDYLEKAPAEVQKHLSNKSQAAGETTSKHHAVAHRNRHAVELHEKHSLGGKYGKTHAVC